MPVPGGFAKGGTFVAVGGWPPCYLFFIQAGVEAGFWAPGGPCCATGWVNGWVGWVAVTCGASGACCAGWFCYTLFFIQGGGFPPPGGLGGWEALLASACFFQAF